MRYQHFRDIFENYPFFKSQLFNHITDNPALLRVQMVDWVNKGLVLELKRGSYTLNQRDRMANFSSLALAQALYQPSYISLETAMSYYQLIPEKVEQVTSIT